MIHLDTGFVVDLQREVDRAGAAAAFLAAHPTEPLTLSVYVLCELEAGVKLARNPERERGRLLTLVEGMTIAYPDDRFAEVYGRTFATLERRGKRMPAMDLLIAVAALADGAPLVTRNVKDFASLPDLRVLRY